MLLLGFGIGINRAYSRSLEIFQDNGFGYGSGLGSPAKRFDEFDFDLGHVNIKGGSIQLDGGELGFHRLLIRNAAAALEHPAVGPFEFVRDTGESANHGSVFVDRAQALDIQGAYGIAIRVTGWVRFFGLYHLFGAGQDRRLHISGEGIETPSYVEHFRIRMKNQVHGTALDSIASSAAKAQSVDQIGICGVYGLVKLPKTGYQFVPG